MKHRVTARLSEEAYRRLYDEATNSGRSMSDILEGFIMRGSLLEEIRLIVREEINNGRL